MTEKKPAVRAWLRIASIPWAITAEALDQIQEIAARHTAESWEAVAAKMGKPLENTWTAEVRDGVAIVPVMGPIFRYANLFTMFSGATSVQDLATDLQAAVEDPAVKAILLNVNSPGGEVDGINEMASLIRAAAATKPLKAYVGGTMASGAYWLGSQTKEIVADPTAMVGSIGVVAGFTDRSSADEKNGIRKFEIVSSQSPKKRLDPATDDGRAAVQAVVDDLAEEFIASVAAARNTTVEKVLSDFGQGGVMTARKALAAGMIDRLGSYEGLLAEMVDSSREMPMMSFGGSAAKSTQGESMKLPTTAEELAAIVTEAESKAKATGKTEGLAEGKAAERTRISAILGAKEATGRENLAKTIALETDTTPEAAAKLLGAAPVQQSQPTNPLVTAMNQVPNPKVGAGAENADEVAAEVQAIIAAGKTARGVK